MPELTASEWDRFCAQFPNAHLLQTTAWGDLKSNFGWEAVRVQAGENLGAQILLRRLVPGLTFAYIPKGPLGPQELSQWAPLWPEVDAACRRRRAVFLKVEPDLWETDLPAGSSAPAGFQPSLHPIQPPRTLLIDLEGDEEQVLGRMKQKTRYNIKLALKKGVVVQPSADVETFQRLLKQTGERDRFSVHSLAYYQRVYELFQPRGMCELLVAEYEQTPLAGLMVFAIGKRAWYFYGASASDHRDRMPTYLLQWEAMRWARVQGCTEYDLWGVPDEELDTLEARFTEEAGGLWGVYRFKRGFGGTLLRSAGPWDRVYQPFVYAIYQKWAASKKNRRDKG